MISPPHIHGIMKHRCTHLRCLVPQWVRQPRFQTAPRIFSFFFLCHVDGCCPGIFIRRRPTPGWGIWDNLEQSCWALQASEPPSTSQEIQERGDHSAQLLLPAAFSYKPKARCLSREGRSERPWHPRCHMPRQGPHNTQYNIGGPKKSRKRHMKCAAR